MLPSRFCPECRRTYDAVTDVSATCTACGAALKPLLDDHGALSAEFLSSRGACCDTGCRNCPYPADAASVAATKTCNRCHDTFVCNPADCWCAGVNLSATTLARLRELHAECLCPSCLAEIAKVGAEA